MSLLRQFRQAEAPKAVVKVEAAPRPPAGKKRGPAPSGKAKQMLTLRLDPDVIEKFRATGPGWQARMNEALRDYAL